MSQMMACCCRRQAIAWNNVQIIDTHSSAISQQMRKIRWQKLLLKMILWYHDDAIKWKHFLRYWPFVRGNSPGGSPVNSQHKGQLRGALMFSLICVWISGWVNKRESGDLRRYRAHYDVIVMIYAAVMEQWVAYINTLYICHLKFHLLYRNVLTNVILWINFVSNVVLRVWNYRLMGQQWLVMCSIMWCFPCARCPCRTWLGKLLFHQEAIVTLDTNMHPTLSGNCDRRFFIPWISSSNTLLPLNASTFM